VGIFNRLFGKKERISGESPILPALTALLQTQSAMEGQRLLKQHPELLSAEADALLGELIKESDKDQVESLTALRAFLRRCREVGIDKAFADQTGGLIPPELELAAILGELSQQGRPDELPARIQLFQKALKFVRREQAPTLWATLHNELGNSLIQNSDGVRAENLEQAITHFEQALTVYTREDFPEHWAIAQNNLAIAYRERILGERADNLERAIAHHEQVLTVRTREACPQDWAITQNNLANAYCTRIRGERVDNLERAIAHYEQALTVRTRETFPQDWAMTQDNLASAYAERIRGERAENLEQAIAHHEQALAVYTRKAFPQDWALTQNNLANTYVNRIRGERADNLERAIAHCEQALTVRTREAFPQDWAMTQNNQGNAYLNRICGERADNLERAIAHFEQALAVYTREAFPEDWARNQNNLANTYVNRIRGERVDNLERAIHHCEQALTVYTREAFPQDWARSQNILASAYYERIRGERADNLERAIHHCEQALTVYTREAFPQDWAWIQNILGSAYCNRIRGERADNLERAIHHYEQALTVRTREAFPQDWAMTQDNLALAYAKRIRSERADNLERAIAYHEQALTVYTREAFPQDWARTQGNLGSAYWNRIRGERADNLERAIHHYEQALTVYTREAFPQDWAGTQDNLATAYHDRIRGERADNLERAIAYHEQALTVYTREAFPQDWAMTQNNLALAYAEHIRGERADNLERAIAHHEQALTVYTREAFPQDWALSQHNLATAYYERIRGERADNLERAIAHHVQALTVRTREAFPQDWAMTQNNLATAYYERIRGDRADNLERAIHHFEQALEVYTLGHFPAEHRGAQGNLGNLYFTERNWALANKAYAAAIAAGSALLATAYTEIGRRAEVGETAQMYVAASYSLLRLKRAAEAWITLEQGKTRLLAEALALGDADLATLPEDQRQAMHAARQTMRELEADMRLPANTPARRSDREIAEALRQARIDLQKLIETIRTTRPDFMPTGLDNLPDLLRLIPLGGALVAPMVTSQGGAVFVLPHGTDRVTHSQVVWLDDLTDKVLRELLGGPADAPELGGWFGAYFNRHSDWQRWLETIKTTGRRLWELLLGPVHERLTELGLSEDAPVILMPQGGLGLLPLHAAWREEDGGKRYFIDDYTVSYAPSGYALEISQRRIQEPRRQQGALLAVVNPTADLVFTSLEGEAVAALFEPSARRVLVEGEANSAAVIAQSPGRSYLHFSCHGFYNWEDPMRSGLILAGGTALTLSEIIARLDLSTARLVTLSACETGLTDIHQSPDEYLGLPAGFLQAGTPAVLSTLWAVSDRSTTLLMVHFYRKHLMDGLQPAAALRQAQRWLRDTTNAEKAAYFESFLSESAGSDMASDIADELYKTVVLAKPDACGFAHPFYWAAFTYTGA